MHLRRRILGLAILTGCLPHKAQLVIPAHAESDVLAAVIEHLRPRLADTILIVDSTIVYDVDRMGARAMGPHRRDSVPDGLRERLGQVSRRPQPSRLLPIRHPVRVLQWNVPGSHPRAADPSMSALLPRRLHVYRFTPVAFNADSTGAYIYYEFFCGSLCGGGEGLWLTRSRGDPHWRVRYVAPYWIS